MKKRKVKRYTEDFKRSSAKLAIESDQPISVTANNLGIAGPTLHGWMKQYSSKAAMKNQAVLGDIDVLAELKRLKKENVRLTMERDILKKATAYFANDTL